MPRIGAQSSDGIEELTAVSNNRDADVFQVLRRKIRQDRFVYLVLAERCLILSKAQAPQPDHNVHDGAHNQWWRASSAGEARLSRGGVGVLGFCKAR